MKIANLRKWIIIPALAVLTLAAYNHAQAAYSIVDLGANVTPRDINNSGQVAAQLNSSGVYSALIYSNGSMQSLGMFGGGSTSLLGINNIGQIIAMNNNTYEGYIYNSATSVLTDIGYGMPTDINDYGQVVGLTLIGGQNFLYQNNTRTDIGTAGATSLTGWTYINNTGQIAGTSNIGTYICGLDGKGVSYITTSGNVHGITDSGQVIGDTFFSGAQHAFLYSGGVLTDLGAFGGFMSMALGINTQGQIVGYSYDSKYNPSPFFYENGQAVDIWSQVSDAAGWTFQRAYGINDNGQIIGTGTLNGVMHGFLLTPEAAPVPIPAAAWLLGSGLMGLVGVRRRFFKA